MGVKTGTTIPFCHADFMTEQKSSSKRNLFATIAAESCLHRANRFDRCGRLGRTGFRGRSGGGRARRGKLFRGYRLIEELVLIILDQGFKFNAVNAGKRFLGREGVAEAELFITGENFAADFIEGEVFPFPIINEALE